MRCSSCEPLLDRYIEGTLTARQMRDIGTHLHACASCRELLDELKVVDGLLFTSKPAELPENFTFAVMAEVNSQPAPRPHTVPIWSFITLYSVAAWVAAIAGMVLSGTSPRVVFTAIAQALAHVGLVSSAFSQSVAHGFAHTFPALAAFGFGVLVIDMAIAGAIALIYFVVRPRLAARLASVPEAFS